MAFYIRNDGSNEVPVREDAKGTEGISQWHTTWFCAYHRTTTPYVVGLNDKDFSLYGPSPDFT